MKKKKQQQKKHIHLMKKKTKQENVTTLAVLRSRVWLRSVWQYHTYVLRRERCWRILKPPASWFVPVRAAAEAQTSEKSMSPEARVLTYQRLTSDPCFGVSPSFSNAFLLPNLFQNMKKKKICQFILSRGWSTRDFSRSVSKTDGGACHSTQSHHPKCKGPEDKVK